MTQQAAIELMDGFAVRTGLRSGAEPRRYLWTDAFAVVTLDGYVTFSRLDAAGGAASLTGETAVLRGLVTGRPWGTTDPLGLGGLLLDAMRLAVLPGRSEEDHALVVQILSGVAGGLTAFVQEGTLAQPAGRRLGFRELGLAIGLQGIEPLAAAVERSAAPAAAAERSLPALRSARPVGERIVQFWLDERNRQDATWQDHRDINEVMLATALVEAQAGTAAADLPAQ